MRRILYEMQKIKERLHLNVLTSANTFYLLMVVIPFSISGFDFSDVKLITFVELFGFGIIYLINSIYGISRYLNNLRLTTDILYKEIPLRNKLHELIKTLIMTMFLLISIVIFIMVGKGLLTKVIEIHYSLYKMFESFVLFSISLFVNMIVYKYTLPVYVPFKHSFNISIILSFVWLIFFSVYRMVYLNIVSSFEYVYRLLFLIYFLYLFNYILIVSFVYYYIKTKNTNF